jgi:predicted lipase
MCGTSSLSDILVDLDNTLVRYTSTGSTECSGGMVHRGFQNQWNAVVADVIEKVGEQVKARPDYTLLCTGHSLCGGLTPFCAVSLEKTFPGKVTAISLASPRTGNPAWISFVEATIPAAKLFRLTNQNDTVPNDLREAEGFKYHATEYWSPRGLLPREILWFVTVRKIRVVTRYVYALFLEVRECDD